MSKSGVRIILEEAKQEFIDRGFIPLFDKYNNNLEKLLAQTKEGYLVVIGLGSLKLGVIPNIFDFRNPYTIHNIKLWLKLNNKLFKLVSENYENNRKYLKWKCFIKGCEETFEMNWSDVSQNRNCPFCVGKQAGLSNCLATKNPELAKEWHPTKNGDLTPYNVTCSSSKKVWWQCEKGHEWQAGIASRNQGNNCPYCRGFYSSETYNLLICNPDLCKEWDYNKNDKSPEEYVPSSHNKVWWACKNCGQEWKASIANRNKGRGCPKCNESKGEKQLDLILTQYNIPHDKQYTYDDLIGLGGGLLRFDVPVFWDIEKTKLRTLFEYDGEFHYEKIYEEQNFEIQQIHDNLKNEYCKNNNIKLIRIPYWEFDNIENIIKKELLI